MTINKKQMEEIEKIVLRILIDKKIGDSVRVEYKRDFDGRVRVVDDYFVRLESAHIIKKRKFTDKDGIDFDLLRGFDNFRRNRGLDADGKRRKVDFDLAYRTLNYLINNSQSGDFVYFLNIHKVIKPKDRRVFYNSINWLTTEELVEYRVFGTGIQDLAFEENYVDDKRTLVELSETQPTLSYNKLGFERNQDYHARNLETRATSLSIATNRSSIFIGLVSLGILAFTTWISYQTYKRDTNINEKIISMNNRLDSINSAIVLKPKDSIVLKANIINKAK